MKKLKLLVREAFFWIPLLLILMLVLTIVLIIFSGEKIDWSLIIGASVAVFLVSGVMLAIAIESVRLMKNLKK